MTEWSVLRLLVGREYRAWRKPFLVSTAIMAILVGTALTIAYVVTQNREPPKYTIAVTGDVPADLEAGVGAFLPEDSVLVVASLPTESAARSAVQAGEADLAVVGTGRVIWGESVSDPLADGVVQTLSVEQARRRAAAVGMTPAQVEEILTPRIAFEDTEPVAGDRGDEGVAVLATIVMFMAIIAYGQWIGYAVVEEKANRVVELLLGAVRPYQLLGAKVVSIGSLGLAQIAIVGIIAVSFGIATDNVAMPDAVRLSTVVWVLVWFFLGYAFYGSLYAAAGSLASNTQEAGSTIGPLALFLVIGYMTGIISFGEGYDTTWLQIMSFFPLWSPLVMPGRIVRGWAMPWEVALSLAIMVVSIYAMVRLAGWIYTGGVARATQKLGWREAFRTGRELGSRA